MLDFDIGDWFMWPSDDTDFIAAYVPNAEFYSYGEAKELARLKDEEAATNLLLSILEGGVI